MACLYGFERAGIFVEDTMPMTKCHVIIFILIVLRLCQKRDNFRIFSRSDINTDPGSIYWNWYEVFAY